MHPTIEEINRWKEPPRYDVLRRAAQKLVFEVQPQLDRLAVVEAELEQLREKRKATA